MKKVILKGTAPPLAVVEIGNLTNNREYLASWGERLYRLNHESSHYFYWQDISEPWYVKCDVNYSSANEACRQALAVVCGCENIWQFDTLGELIDFAATLRTADKNKI